jgi:hypothetical protein
LKKNTNRKTNTCNILCLVKTHKNQLINLNSTTLRIKKTIIMKDSCRDLLMLLNKISTQTQIQHSMTRASWLPCTLKANCIQKSLKLPLLMKNGSEGKNMKPNWKNNSSKKLRKTYLNNWDRRKQKRFKGKKRRKWPCSNGKKGKNKKKNRKSLSNNRKKSVRSYTNKLNKRTVTKFSRIGSKSHWSSKEKKWYKNV